MAYPSPRRVSMAFQTAARLTPRVWLMVSPDSSSPDFSRESTSSCSMDIPP